jgi:hypothetical protein
MGESDYRASVQRNGRFVLQVAPGSYDVTGNISAAVTGPPVTCRQYRLNVTAGRSRKLNVVCTTTAG